MPIWSIKFKQDANTETRPTLDPPLTHHRTVNIPEGSLLTIQNLSLRFVFFPVDPTKSKKTQSCKTLILNKEQETSASHVKTDNERSPCAHQSCNLPASRANSFPFLPLHSYVTDICCITLSILSPILVLSPETLSLISLSLLFLLSPKLGFASWKGYCGQCDDRDRLMIKNQSRVDLCLQPSAIRWGSSAGVWRARDCFNQWGPLQIKHTC